MLKLNGLQIDTNGKFYFRGNYIQVNDSDLDFMSTGLLTQTTSLLSH